MPGVTTGTNGVTGEVGRLWRVRPPAFDRAPRRWFHVLLALPTLALLWAVTVPGINFFLAVGASWVLAVFGLTWVVRLGVHVVARSRGRDVGSARWFWVAPIGAVIVLALVWADVPLRARWATSRGDFENALERAPTASDDDEWISFDAPTQLGSYEIIRADRVGDGVIFYEATGALLDDAGFAYLPDGPSENVETTFESPEFRSLGGGWYAWTASW